MLKINVCGCLYTISVKKLERFPDSLLYKLSKVAAETAVGLGLCERYNSCSHEFYFERPVHIFPTILSVYLTGSVHITSAVCAVELYEELKFWILPTSALDPFCIQNIPEGQKHLWVASKSKLTCEYDGLPSRFYFNLRRSLWYILEKPGSCKLALIFMIVSILFIFVSMCILVMGTLPAFQYFSKRLNRTRTIRELHTADYVCVGWFTLEYLLRMLTAPSAFKYIRSAPAVVDLLSCMPTYVEIALSFYNSVNNKGDVAKFMFTLRVMRLLRMFRCFRLIKLIRYSAGLMAIFRTLRKSFTILMLMIAFIAGLDLIISSMVYFFEADVNGTEFASIPAAAWWGIVTITTVGYGDMIPTTIGGKIVASIAVLLGILVIALPVSIISDAFRISYAEVREEFADNSFNYKSLWLQPWLPKFPENTEILQKGLNDVAHEGK